MNIFKFKRQKGLNEIKELEKSCENLALKTYVKDIEKHIVEVLFLDKKSDQEIIDEYKYKIWGRLSGLEQKYLCKRFNFVLCDNYREAIFTTKTMISQNPVCKSEPVGVGIEKYREN